jgi:hypothetical protein
MENSPPNCHITFYSGQKINTDTRASTVTIKSSSHADIVINTRESRNVNLPVDLVPLFKHSQDCLSQCLEIEKGCGTDTVYPLVLKNQTTGLRNSVDSRHGCLSIHASSIGMTEKRDETQHSLDTRFIERVGWCVKTGDMKWRGY